MSIDANPAVARASLRPLVAAELSQPSSRAHLEPLGIADDVARLLDESGSLREFAERLPEEWIDELAVVGDPAQCADRIRQMHHAGADSLVLSLPADVDNHQHDLLTREVMALLR